MSIPRNPSRVVYVRPDTIGDLVIFSSALSQLCAAWPEARHVLLVRAGYEMLAPLLSLKIEWLTTRVNPFKQQPNECHEDLLKLLATLDYLDPDMIVASTVHRTWLEVVVAAHFPKARCVVLGKNSVDPISEASLQYDMGINAKDAFHETITVDPNKLAWECNHLLADYLIGSPTSHVFPKLTIPPHAAQAASAFLAANRLAPGQYVALFPAGVATVPIKTWPPAHFAELAGILDRKHKLPLLLLAHASEAGIIDSVAGHAAQNGLANIPVWLGRDEDICVLAALLGECRFYLGNDTGPMHIAAALDRAVVGIFGGGTWPRFRPVGRKTVSVVKPLPCFGCNWDCSFGDAPCLQTIPVADVKRAVDIILTTDPQKDFDEIIEAAQFPAETMALVKAASLQYNAAQKDRLIRGQQINILTKLSEQDEADQGQREPTIREPHQPIDPRGQQIGIWPKLGRENQPENAIYKLHKQAQLLKSRLAQTTDRLAESEQQAAALSARLELSLRELHEYQLQLVKCQSDNQADPKHRDHLTELTAKLETLDKNCRDMAAVMARKDSEFASLQRAAWIRLGARLGLLKSKDIGL